MILAIATFITIRIFFTGLIAFTPDEFTCGGKVRALLVDTTNPPLSSDGCHLHAHKPTLFFYSDDCGPCEKEGRLCRCSLIEDRYLLDLPLDTDSKKPLCWEAGYTPSPSPTGTSICNGTGFTYVPKMKDLRVPLPWVADRAKLKQSCNRDCPARPGTPTTCNLITGQVNLNFHTVTACLLTGETEQSAMAPRLKLEPRNTGNFWDANPQLTAEITRFTHLVSSEPNPESIKLTFVNFARTASFDLEIPVQQTQGGGYFADLLMGNIMDGEAPEGQCSNEFIARDFELFHDLVRGPLPPSDRPIPQLPENAAKEKLPDGVGGTTCDDSMLFRIYKADFLRAGKTRSICPETSIDY